MKKIVQRGLYFTLFVGGLSCLGVAAANAADTTTGEDGLLSGTQTVIGLEVPVDLSGNAITAVGDATTTSEAAPAPAAEPAAESAPEATTSGEDGAASGTQAVIDAAVPIDVSGNAISVIGDSEQSGSTDAAPAEAAPAEAPSVATTTGSDSLLGGTQGLVNIDIPITVGGNAITVIGDA
ncbi:chaplin family protein, partial [Agreia sp.]|uniref:chaplin family protein n=1 Tax=Agreia sp. TaxID=1872416 RepID=UPI0035BBAF69